MLYHFLSRLASPQALVLESLVHKVLAPRTSIELRVGRVAHAHLRASLSLCSLATPTAVRTTQTVCSTNN